MKILIVTYFFLSIFSIFSSGYTFNFKKVKEIPSDIVCYDYNKLREKNQINDEVYKFLKGFYFGMEDFHYSFDLKNETGVCLKKFDLKELYQILFAYKSYISDGIRQLRKKPIVLGVNKNIVVYLTLDGDFYILEIPLSTNPYTQERIYYHRNTLEEKKINFDKDTNNLIKEKLCQFVNDQIYCFPGNEGEFYFTFNPCSRKEMFLLTIKKNDNQILKDPSDNIPPTENKIKLPHGTENFFMRKKKYFFCGAFAVGILLIVFRSFIKNNMIQLFLKNKNF